MVGIYTAANGRELEAKVMKMFSKSYYSKPLQTMNEIENIDRVSSLKAVSSSFQEQHKNWKIVIKLEEAEVLTDDYDQVQKISTKDYGQQVFALIVQTKFQKRSSKRSKGTLAVVSFGNPKKFGVTKNGKAGAALSIGCSGQIIEITVCNTPFRLVTSMKDGWLVFGVLTGDEEVDQRLRVAGFHDDPVIAVRYSLKIFLTRHPEKLPKVKVTEKSNSSKQSATAAAAAAVPKNKRARHAQTASPLQNKQKRPTRYDPLEIELSNKEVRFVNPPQGRDAFAINQRAFIVAAFSSLKIEDLPAVLQRLKEEYSYHKWSPVTLHFVLDQFKDFVPSGLKQEFVSQVKKEFARDLVPIVSLNAAIEEQQPSDNFSDVVNMEYRFLFDEVTPGNGETILPSKVLETVDLARAEKSDTEFEHEQQGDGPEDYQMLSVTTMASPVLGLVLEHVYCVPESSRGRDMVEIMQSLEQTPVKATHFDLDTAFAEDAHFWKQDHDARPPTPRCEDDI